MATENGEHGSQHAGSTAEVLHRSVLDTLGLEITGGALTTGHALTLDGIQERFDVSRTVARETMRVLESMGLVVSRRRVGITVQAPSSWHVYDPRVIWWRLSGPGRDAQLRSLTELRIAVEPLAAAASARYASPGQRERLVHLAQDMRRFGESGRLAPFMDLDVHMHALLLTASGNEMFAALTDVVEAVLRGRTQLGLMPHRPVPEALDLHERVAHAVAEADPTTAEQAMRHLLTEVHHAIPPP
ncbi:MULTISPECIES: FadR/GntR family transcriptional regulator [unclassified Streptomyces]|uniref:FadR/GntR family transcriptional regulator n=1 Tax=unclassified Streptomyces TaxID=2593676 RepID=UPI0022B6BFDF|nr:MULTISPECIES: FCD domain-containing protein [unclassified Streptomyces]MCZ7413197.1 FCD domain-containing protein [Streptomyces sp. WMMC897]MCZ7430190.1 FCD domain-containing protein [Streptomyces sp. WMMC1477]